MDAISVPAKSIIEWLTDRNIYPDNWREELKGIQIRVDNLKPEVDSQMKIAGIAWTPTYEGILELAKLDFGKAVQKQAKEIVKDYEKKNLHIAEAGVVLFRSGVEEPQSLAAIIRIYRNRMRELKRHAANLSTLVSEHQKHSIAEFLSQKPGADIEKHAISDFQDISGVREYFAAEFRKTVHEFLADAKNEEFFQSLVNFGEDEGRFELLKLMLSVDTSREDLVIENWEYLSTEILDIAAMGKELIRGERNSDIISNTLKNEWMEKAGNVLCAERVKSVENFLEETQRLSFLLENDTLQNIMHQKNSREEETASAQAYVERTNALISELEIKISGLEDEISMNGRLAAQFRAFLEDQLSKKLGRRIRISS